jgi:glycerol-3-phosphate dehydrogenase
LDEEGMETTILIVGGGITGMAIARELSKYDVKVALIEKEADIAFGGPTKANTAIIHAGYDDEPGTMAASLCVRGNVLWTRLSSELSISFDRIGSLVVALDDEEVPILQKLIERGRTNGVQKLKIVKGEELFGMEPNLSSKAVAGLYAATAGIICPYEAAMALAENAKMNGVSILLETMATGVSVRDGEIRAVQTNRGAIHARYVINAAGLFSDEVSAMAGIDEFKITPRKGEYVIYDKDLDGLVNHVLFPTPTPVSKGIVVTPTVDGNIIAGPTAHDIDNKQDTATTSAGLQEVLKGAYKLVPELSARYDAIISGFAGLRPQPSTGGFIIKSYGDPSGFMNVAGMKSPGLTSAPAIVEMVLDTLKAEGLDLGERSDFRPFREPIVHPLRAPSSNAEELIADDRRYGHVVCRCEHVTESEILEAIRRGAETLDGIKYRARAGMGRCQGGFCTPHVIRILARELEISVEEVTKKGGDSRILLYRAKQLLTEG